MKKRVMKDPARRRRLPVRILISALSSALAVGLLSPVADAKEPFNPAAPPPAPANPPAQTLPTELQPVTPVDEGAPPAPTLDPPDAPVTAPTASDEAVRTGNPVEVTEYTTGTRQVLANPDGTFTSTTNRVPVRAKKNGTWVPIDTTLHPTAQGTLAPAATAENVAFSGGGDAPLITLTEGDGRLTFSWPESLPVPHVDGATATYADVFPGVDLRLTAEASSYSQVLVVHDAEAAANPALTDLHLTATATNLTLSADRNGALVATDAAGAVVFRGATPLMWDSTHDPSAGLPPSATDPGTGHITPIPASATPVTSASARAATASSTVDVVINPETDALTGPDVTYPVYIDPSMSRGEEFWVEVTANGWYYINQNQLAQVGYCGSWAGCNGLTIARSYFRMGTQDIAGRPNGRVATVFSAQFYANQVWGAHNCVAEPVDVNLAGVIDDNTRWPGPEGPFINRQFSAAGTNCGGPNNVIFDVTSAAQTAADNAWPNLTLQLRAPDEGNQYQWKQFANNPTLVVNYSYPPNPATGLAVSNAVNCNGRVYTSDARPTLTATATDNNNPPLNPQLWFDLFNGAGTSTVATGGPITIASGTTGRWTEPVSLASGDYKFRVNVSTNVGNTNPASHEIWAGAYSPWYSFTRLAPPTQTPYINSYDYPSNYWGQPSNNPETVYFSANGASNIAGFTWTLSGAGTESAPITTDCNYTKNFGTNGGYIAADSTGWAALVLPTGLSVGYHTLYVRSFDHAHNLSPESQPYTFYVAPPVAGVGGWFEAENLPVSQPAGQNITVGAQGNCCGLSWSGGKQLWFQGNAAGQSFTLTLNAPTTANYDLAVNLTKAPDYGKLTFTLDGKSLGLPSATPVDAYSSTVVTRYQSLGGAYLTAGTHTLKITVAGSNPSSTGSRYMAGIDNVFLRPSNQIDVESPQLAQAAAAPGSTITPAPEASNNGSSWRGGAQLLYPATAVNQAFTLTVTAPVEADYALGVNLTQRANYGQLSFVLDDSIVLGDTKTTPVDTYSAASTWTYRPLGGVHLTAGTHVLTVTVVGKNPSSSGYQAGIDYLTLAAINNVTAASFSAAMNNDGIAIDNTTPANLDLWGGNALSSAAMNAAGLAPGANVTVNGATFTMPASNGGYDNVIAAGQTIPFPAGQQIKANAVGLLAASTCGTSPAAGAVITYTDGTTSRPTVPSVPDWVYGDGNSATTVLSYIDNENGIPMSGRAGKLYTIFLPADPTKTVQKVTLPYTGTGMLTETCNTGDPITAALHVFAMAPRPASGGPIPAGASGWLGSWAAPVDAAVVPPGGAGFGNQTIRMIVRPNETGAKARIRLSNTGAGMASPPQLTTATVTIDAATIAAQAGTTGSGAGTLAAPVSLTFAGNTSVTLPAGGEVLSDPVDFPATTGGSGNLVVSLHLPNPVPQAPVHTAANAPTYLANGNTTTDTSGTPYTTTLTSDFYLTGLEVTTTDPTAGTVAILSDQTAAVGAPTAGRTDQRTWVDCLPGILGASLPGSVVNISRAGMPARNWWKLADGTGTTAGDSAGLHPATLGGGVTWNPTGAGSSAGSAQFDGTSGAITTSAVLNTARSFTVSAWVKLDTNATTQTIVSQDGGQNSGFSLQYDKANDRWAFTRVIDNTANSAVVRALSKAAPQTGTWTNVVGTFDASTQAMTLYVNGAYQSSVATTTSPNLSGTFAIGRGKAAGAAANYLDGAISDVRVYQNAFNGLDVTALWDGPAAQQPNPTPGAPSAFTVGNTSGNGGQLVPGSSNTALNQALLAQPNLRTVIMSLGANDILNNEPLTEIEANLLSLFNSNPSNGYSLKRSFRPDGTPLHAIITTIPPLGLTTADPREALRVALNNDIRANFTRFGADEYVDLDQAVADTAGNHPNQINPAYLTNNQPNAAYYQALAQAIADAVDNFPPSATL
ncbi:LamG-like jellyroll fold domain-containing protein [Amycolatopsis thermoflava]|uniref:LamG-like jellyroll fold domain-containing protein n=1 Tax=Amycolatopsis thermoflava TaxID=84480 RepID=UPI000A04BD37|nr:LamG-like jellyroll fold domain-containing protein [Amycolatopsis thermoflava]